MFFSPPPPPIGVTVAFINEVNTTNPRIYSASVINRMRESRVIDDFGDVQG